MKKFRNINVLQLLDMIHEKPEEPGKSGFFYTVTPYISSDLNGLLNNPRVKMTVPQIKCIMKQILSGINYIHAQKYLHRDIKTANILLDYFGVVKIADFGLARCYHGSPPLNPDDAPGGGKVDYTGLVVTRWYRPPELLLGDTKYTTAVDMWGIGCVLGEMYKRKPILEGTSDLDQADIIFKLLGSPNEDNYPGCQNVNRNGVTLNVNYKRTLEQEYEKLMSPSGVQLLSSLLTMDPKRRANAAKALKSDYFTTEPLPCRPRDLPKFEESHESDIKRFKEELKRGLTIPQVPSAGYKPKSMDYVKYDEQSRYEAYYPPDDTYADPYGPPNGYVDQPPNMRRENRTNYSRFLPEDQMMGQDYYYPEDYPPPPAIYGAPPLMNPSSLPPIPPQSYQPHYTQPKNSWTAQQRSASNNINNSGNNKSRSTLASTYRPPASEGTRQASSWVPADRHSGGDLYRKETYRSSERAGKWQ
ncbi:unnamed protein product [Ambrosiozyma monospora]|uniref:Unnamed protein product n=1 Tax=Ambrosiozyma monospora TaxID=43982 RepID=A0ACB5TBC5_AMBMO|nr:unnamed protein product [Ambrosiozyma monospora]